MADDKRIEENILQFRLEATRDVQKMSRLAFLISTIFSLAIIAATWNFYFSWYTGFVLNEAMPANPLTEVVHKKVIEQWVESSNVSILAFMGIKIGIADCTILGSIGLLIINTWLFLSIHREYDAIHSLCYNTRNPDRWDAESREWLYYGIAFHMLFMNINQITRSSPGKRRWHHRLRPKSMTQFAFKVLVFLPAISIFFLILADILAIFVLPVPYRFPHTPLLEHLQLVDTVKLIIIEVLACVFLSIIIVLCTKILAYVESTAKDLDKYATEYRNDLKKENQNSDKS